MTRKKIAAAAVAVTVSGFAAALAAIGWALAKATPDLDFWEQ